MTDISPGRLLRTAWKSAADLAVELYAMATSKEQRVVNAPVEMIAPPEGKPALKVRRLKPGETQDVLVAPGELNRAVLPREGPGHAIKVDFGQPGRQPFENFPGVPATATQTIEARQRKLAADATKIATLAAQAFSSTPARQIQVRDSSAEAPVIADGLPRSPLTSPGFPVTAEKPKGFTGSKLVGLASVPPTDPQARPKLPPDVQVDQPMTPRKLAPADFSRPHPYPIVDIDGAVSFTGPEPVQFDSAPMVLSKKTGRYESLEPYLNEGLGINRIPWGQNPFRLCQIGDTDIPPCTPATVSQPIVPSSGSGKIYSFDGESVQPGMEVVSPDTVFNASDNNLHKGSWHIVAMILTEWFVVAPPSRARFAKSPGGGIAAMAGDVPGTASCVLYNYDGSTLTAAETATVANIGSTAVAATVWMIVTDVQGFWVVDVEPC